MDKIEFYNKRIRETEIAISKTKSPYCKRDLEKCLKRLNRELKKYKYAKAGD